MKALNRLFALATLSLVALTGCVQVATIPHVARPGETVMLGLGGIKRNWQGETPKNVQLTITDSASNSFSLTPASFFQAYPDYRAGVNANSLFPNNAEQMQPFDGAWFVSTKLVDGGGQPLALATGAATIAVTGDNLNEIRDGLGQMVTTEGNLAAIPIEIIAGTPSSNGSSAQFAAYESGGSYFLARPSTTPTASVGGAYYVIDFLSDAEYDPQQLPAVYPVAHNPYINLNYTIKRNTDGSGTYHIYIYNTAGFVGTTPRTSKQGSLEDLDVHLEYFSPQIDIGSVKANFTLDTTDSYFVDLNGNKITGLQAEMLHASDL